MARTRDKEAYFGSYPTRSSGLEAYLGSNPAISKGLEAYLSCIKGFESLFFCHIRIDKGALRPILGRIHEGLKA